MKRTMVIPEDIWERLNALAKEWSTSKSQAVRRLIQEAHSKPEPLTAPRAPSHASLNPSGMISDDLLHRRIARAQELFRSPGRVWPECVAQAAREIVQ